MLGRSVFTQKQVSGPRTANSQPIWIKFYTRLLLYGIHLWADGSPRFRRQTVKVGVRTGAIVKHSGIL